MVWRIIPETNFDYEMNENKEIRKRGKRNLIKNYSDDFRYIFVQKDINEPPPARTREEVYELTFKDEEYVAPVIPEEKKTRGEKFFEELRKEGCEPISEYKTYMDKVDYMYDGIKYSVTPNNWIHYKTRPHIIRRRFDIEYVKAMFGKYGCELLEDKWVNTHTPMRYIYEGKEYVKTWESWKYNFMKSKKSKQRQKTLCRELQSSN